MSHFSFPNSGFGTIFVGIYSNSRLMKYRLALFLLLIVITGAYSCTKEEDPDSTSGLYDLYIYDLSTATNTNITNSLKIIEYPQSFSTDGKKVLYKTVEGVFTVNIDGTDSQILIPVAANEKSDMELSPNGNEYAYSKDGVLYLMNSDGTNERRLTNYDFKLWRPIWSKDGKYVASSADNGIVIVNMDGNIELITPDKPAGWYDWSSDSKKLAYSKYDNDKYPQVFVFDIVTKNENKLTSSQLYSRNSFWRPESEDIVFTSSKSDYGSDLILMSSGGTVQKTILHQLRIDSPAWSPDGNKIAFINENSDLALIDPDGSNYKVLNNIPGACMQPIWSPDSKYILYYRAIFYN